METALLGAAEIRDLAERAGIRPTKTLGQNFVIDPNTIRRIISTAKIGPEETVLEVGPGLGSLTLGLLDAAERVVAVEIDPPLAEQLPDTVRRFRPEKADRLDVVLSDAMKVRHLPVEPTALVANLPYNVAVPVLLHLLAQFPSITHGLVMVQDEVADRLAAEPGNKTYGVPSVKASWFAEVRKAGVIGTNVFWPAPKIRSGLVSFTRREEPLADVDRAALFGVIDAAFAQRRKTLRAALAGWAGSSQRAGRILEAAGVDPTLRGERLAVNEFISIARAAETVPAWVARGDVLPRGDSQ
ncbi:16S rRNA (adenine(1518)-N(6)/adenine(1519)-N(6))-dimethyltransferase RsmA [Kocuria massiliensis]|uniref:16S rRNA (adenine(1518)-N(6)/adenine(1519)-N(6))- dimethyltransferase RsmA n=1 Tax=Kocuria massiliensis TaxID=1926282 RepID=UPI0022B95104|nr:16S rRNA (adenine(1518)-N(6)/adenine(1519)-N(6))-dimethyltransferase RsmA [Kocuria massiliensis]